VERKSKDVITELENKIARLEQKQQLSDALLLMLATRAIELNVKSAFMPQAEKVAAPAPPPPAPPPAPVPTPIEVAPTVDLREEARQLIVEIAQKMGLQPVNGFDKHH
jgi:hypothetical protein